MPIVLPADLLAFLVEKGIFPGIAASELKKFWDNAREKQLAWARYSGNDRVHPLYLWADDAQYNERGVGPCLGHLHELPLLLLSVDCAEGRTLTEVLLHPKINVKNLLQPIAPASEELSLGFKTLKALLKPEP